MVNINGQGERVRRTSYQRALEFMQRRSLSILKDLTADFDRIPSGSNMYDAESGTLSAINGEDKEAALIKVEFVADVHGHSYRRGREHIGYDLAAYEAISKAYKSRGEKLRPPFKHTKAISFETDKEDNPYYRMLSHLRDRDGQRVRPVEGPEYAARAFLGDIAIAEPDYDIEINDERTRQLIQTAFPLG